MRVVKKVCLLVTLMVLTSSAIAARVSPLAATEGQGETSPFSYNVNSTSWWCSTSTSACQNYSPNENTLSGLNAHGCVSLLTGWVSLEAVDAWCSSKPWS